MFRCLLLEKAQFVCFNITSQLTLITLAKTTAGKSSNVWSTSTCGIFLFFFFFFKKPPTSTPRNELTRITWVSQLSPPKKGGQAWCKSNSKPSQMTSQMTDPVTNPKQKALVRDASQASLWHQDSLQSRDNYLWEVFYHHTFSTNARCAQCLHHTHNTRDLWWCCCARADSPSLTLFKVLNSIMTCMNCL